MAIKFRRGKPFAFIFALLMMLCTSGAARAQNAPSSDELVKHLTSRDTDERQRAAEELARLAEPQHRRMVEGYRLQEKDARVRLALDWALYRMGKPTTLFAVVRDLDSKRSNQALTYLNALESPRPLYIFLPQASFNTQVKLLEVLARVGDAETIERIKPLAVSLDPLIANAAKFAEREITRRLEQPPASPSERPRTTTTGQSEITEP